MSSFPHPNMRTDLRKLYRRIDRRFSALNSFFELKPSSSTDMENHKWKHEWEECKRLSTRFDKWATTYKPWSAGQEYDTKRMMAKKRELLTLYNKLYDATTNLCIGTKYPTFSIDSWWTVAKLTSMSWKDDFADSSSEDEPNPQSDDDSDSSSDDDKKKQRLPLKATPQPVRTEDAIKKQYVQLLLKIAHQVYECEKFQFGLEDFGPGLYTAPNDGKDEDANRVVYKTLCESEDEDENKDKNKEKSEDERERERREREAMTFKLFEIIRNKDVAAPPMLYWKRHLKKLVPDWEPIS